MYKFYVRFIIPIFSYIIIESDVQVARSRRVGERGESGGVPKGCRCEALRSPEEQSEAIPIGMASTIIPTYVNDYVSILGSVLLVAIPTGIVASLLTKTPNICFLL